MARARRRGRRRQLRGRGGGDTQEPIGRDLRRAAGREAARREGLPARGPEGGAHAGGPDAKIREEIAAGELKVLPLEDGGDVFGEIYLVLADPEGLGPGVRRLAEILKQDVRSECARRPREGTP